jgi:hypothetical protein
LSNETSFCSKQFIPFDERILRSKSNVIALRRLGLASDLSRDLIGMELAQQAFKEQKFRMSWVSLVWAALFPPKRQAEVKVGHFHLIICVVL